jgi:hypothetical protein
MENRPLAPYTHPQTITSLEDATMGSNSLSRLAIFAVGAAWITVATLPASDALAAELFVGAATASITPDKPVALSGQHHVRIAQTVDNPVTATALALESRQGAKVLDQAVMISCDLVAIRDGVTARLRERIKPKLPGFDAEKLIISATHTHTGPVTTEPWYEIPKEGVMQREQYTEFLLDRLTEIVVKAWEGRRPGGVSWTLGHAVVGQTRRAVYADGHAQMYGGTAVPEFRRLETGEDHAVDVLFFWDRPKKLRAIAIAVPCPSQEVEGRSTLGADFWHDVREQLHAKYGPELCVLGWTAPAGDQSPHLMYRKAAEERMRTLRGLSATQEIARRIVGAVNDTMDVAQGDIRFDVPLVHRVEPLRLPMRKISDREVADARARCEALAAKPQRSGSDFTLMALDKHFLERYEKQKTDPNYEMELHVLRLGDVAIATNPFELFVDYGVRIKARSPAVQTILIQLACGSGIYVPTEEALRGGGYGTKPQESIVGPEGGQKLVERTLELIGAIWKGK